MIALAGRSLLGREFLGVGALEEEPISWARQIWSEVSIHQLGQAIEQHSFDAHVIVEIFDIFE